MDIMGLQEIEDDVRYQASMACRFIRGRNGRPLDLKALHRWRKAGRVKLLRIGGLWYITGAELRRLVAGVPDEVETKADDADTAETDEVPRGVIAELRRLGVDV